MRRHPYLGNGVEAEDHIACRLRHFMVYRFLKSMCHGCASLCKTQGKLLPGWNLMRCACHMETTKNLCNASLLLFKFTKAHQRSLFPSCQPGQTVLPLDFGQNYPLIIRASKSHLGPVTCSSCISSSRI